jgi:glucose-1-phosphate thymidylyltransferase
LLKAADAQVDRATVFAYHVHDPERYGVVAVQRPKARPSALKKSQNVPKSNYAVTGLYFYDNAGG